jgi:hypothetical protein
MDYPETSADYNGYMNELRTRKAVPSGHVRASYECTAWYRTNNLVIPKVSKLEVYLPPANGSLPGRIFSLEATELEVRAGIESLLPQISTETLVADYRYKELLSRIFSMRNTDSDPRFRKSGNDPML